MLIVCKTTTPERQLLQAIRALLDVFSLKASRFPQVKTGSFELISGVGGTYTGRSSCQTVQRRAI